MNAGVDFLFKNKCAVQELLVYIRKVWYGSRVDMSVFLFQEVFEIIFFPGLLHAVHSKR